jgi:hypothetical protein
MNTIVYILFVWSHGGGILPSIEFTTMEKCEKMATYIQQTTSKGKVFEARKPFCMKVEK